MRFLLFLTQIEGAWERAPSGEPERVYEQYMQVERDLKAHGKLIESLRLRPRSEAKTLRNRSDGSRPTDEGTFGNTEESIGGCYVLDCESMDEAIEWAQRMPNYGHGSIEIRPIWD